VTFLFASSMADALSVLFAPADQPPAEAADTAAHRRPKATFPGHP